jgi:hypothetical protein
MFSASPFSLAKVLAKDFSILYTQEVLNTFVSPLSAHNSKRHEVRFLETGRDRISPQQKVVTSV